MFYHIIYKNLFNGQKKQQINKNTRFNLNADVHYNNENAVILYLHVQY